MTLPKPLERINSLPTRTKLVSLATFLLLATSAVTVWAVNNKSSDVEIESQASECNNAQATASWPSTPGCLVSKSVSWNSVRYILKVFYPQNLDPDRDGFSNEDENFIGTNRNDKCSWPPDINGDGSVQIGDIGHVVLLYGYTEGDPEYDSRRDLDADGAITIIDIGKIVRYYGDSCNVDEDIPKMTASVSVNSFNAINFESNESFSWEVCYPNCVNSTYTDSGKSNSNSNGNISFSWTGITYRIVAFDQDCGPSVCQVPGTTLDVTGTSANIPNLYPNRSHRLSVCYPTCQVNRLQVVTFTSPNCSGSGGRYSVLITGNNSANPIQSEVTNLSSTSHTFRNLKANTDYDFYVYSPSENHTRTYKRGDFRSDAGTCSLSESQMQDAIHLNINLKRGENSLPNLSIHNTMVTAARVRARESIESFSHTRPDGRGADTVLTDHGLTWTYYGEILGKNNYAGDVDSINVVINDWMNSSGHRGIILGPNFTQMGAGVIKHSDGFKYYSVQFRKP